VSLDAPELSPELLLALFVVLYLEERRREKDRP
jgi:hypothetical protein